MSTRLLVCLIIAGMTVSQLTLSADIDRRVARASTVHDLPPPAGAKNQPGQASEAPQTLLDVLLNPAPLAVTVVQFSDVPRPERNIIVVAAWNGMKIFLE